MDRVVAIARGRVARLRPPPAARVTRTVAVGDISWTQASPAADFTVRGDGLSLVTDQTPAGYQIMSQSIAVADDQLPVVRVQRARRRWRDRDRRVERRPGRLAWLAHVRARPVRRHADCRSERLACRDGGRDDCRRPRTIPCDARNGRRRLGAEDRRRPAGERAWRTGMERRLFSRRRSRRGRRGNRRSGGGRSRWRARARGRRTMPTTCRSNAISCAAFRRFAP